jgi:SET domain-containing protein
VYFEHREITLPDIVYYACRDIRVGEQLTIDYEQDWDEQCECGALTDGV